MIKKDKKENIIGIIPTSTRKETNLKDVKKKMTKRQHELEKEVLKTPLLLSYSDIIEEGETRTKFVGIFKTMKNILLDVHKRINEWLHSLAFEEIEYSPITKKVYEYAFMEIDGKPQFVSTKGKIFENRYIGVCSSIYAKWNESK